MGTKINGLTYTGDFVNEHIINNEREQVKFLQENLHDLITADNDVIKQARILIENNDITRYYDDIIYDDLKNLSDSIDVLDKLINSNKD